ncbi:MAG: hypothetical protein AB7T06_36055 [Kofleriaceae bacterium]
MRGVLALATIALGGCGFSINAGDSGAGSGVDGSTDDAECTTFSTFIDTCDLPRGSSLDLTGMHTFDTDQGVLTDAIGTVIPVKTATINLANNAIDVQAIFVDELSLDGTLRGVGTRPFAIIATGDVELVGTSLIEVGMGGAGAQTACANPAKDGEPDSTGAGGGGGGALGADGGHGGDGDSDGDGSAGAEGGVAIAAPSAIIGGCSGGRGGDADPDIGGAGGAGGGAVFVASATRISIGAAAGINAGGAGGQGGNKDSDGDAGGGGGGSGGTILLEAPRVRNDGTLSANGGGGGEGSDDGGSSGDPGDDAILGTASAVGGDGKSSGGAGGAFGGNSTNPSGGPKPSKRPGGGGGGGGSIGFIRVVAGEMDIGSKVSPTPLP